MERILSRPTFYGQINCFPKEISALKLASSAINCIKKFKNDYKLGSFHQLMEWRCCIEDLDKIYSQHPHPEEFTTIINDENVFSPSLLDTMQNNSEKLSIHLNILCLSKCSTQLDNDTIYVVGNRPLRNDEILDYATMHDLPIFIGIDGSLKDDSAMHCCTKHSSNRL
jgi:hypothetical protein